MSCVPHAPTSQTSALVKAMAAYGVPQPQIAAVLDVDPKTLRKHYRRELDIAATEANAKVAETLFKQATTGNIAAAIFWLKARAGWRETQQIAIEGGIAGSVDLSRLSAEELAALKDIRRKVAIEDDDTTLAGDD